METKKRITNLIDEIGKEVAYSMNYLVKELTGEFKITADDLPFLPLYVYFKKNTLEQIFLLSYPECNLTDEAIKDLEEHGIVYNKKFKTYKFKGLRDFEIKDAHCTLDLAALKDYFWTIESWLYGYSYSDLLYDLYFPLTTEKSSVPIKMPESEAYDEPFVKVEAEGPPSVDDVYSDISSEIADLEYFKESNWIIYKEETVGDTEIPYIHCLKDELFYAYYEARKVLNFPNSSKKKYADEPDKAPESRREILRDVITVDKLKY